MSDTALITCFCATEDEYLQEFQKLYSIPIITPDGFTVICKYLKDTAIHVCCGKDGKKFQKTRGERIPWIKYILLNPQDRIVLFDKETKNIIFYFLRKKHAVICAPMKDGRLNLITAFAVSGQRAIDYQKANPPYFYYKRTS